METTHAVHYSDARAMDAVDDKSVDLVVTSPPYPMIEMWDDVFASLGEGVEEALDRGDGQAAFDRMHDALAEVWAEVDRTVAPGGTVCINIGDATRKVDGDFRLFPNHTAVIDWFRSNGYQMLPDILWRKPSNRKTKFMGSGMVPPNAYVAYEHEYILIFRKGGGTRDFEPNLDERYESAYFWEERNQWFSDLWTDVSGATQAASDGADRDRTAAYPLEVPYRLINMYSIHGDTVLDPFLGTGTTTVAALAAGRNSIGYEVDESFRDAITARIHDAPETSADIAHDRLQTHQQYVSDNSEGDHGYESVHYPTPVRTKQERQLRFYRVADVSEVDGVFTATHEPAEWPAAPDEH